LYLGLQSGDKQQASGFDHLLLFGGRCEEKQEEDGRVCQLGNFWNRFKNSDFSAVLPQCTGFEILDFSAVSRDFLGTPKILKTRIFPQCLRILKDGLVQKFLAVFPAMNRAQNLFPAMNRAQNPSKDGSSSKGGSGGSKSVAKLAKLAAVHWQCQQRQQQRQQRQRRRKRK
jgi:hypothetical protein